MSISLSLSLCFVSVFLWLMFNDRKGYPEPPTFRDGVPMYVRCWFNQSNRIARAVVDRNRKKKKKKGYIYIRMSVTVD